MPPSFNHACTDDASKIPIFSKNVDVTAAVKILSLNILFKYQGSLTFKVPIEFYQKVCF